jgi:[acyl-carrier-protein] S-malonyltransferase
LVLLFGGQSSRDEEMFDRLEAAHAAIGGAARARAAEILDGDPADFSTNRTVQVSVMAATLGWLEVVNGAGLASEASGGLSLGEFAHLVDIEAITPEACLALVARRGDLYDDGPDGAMAAIFPASWGDLAPLVDRVADAHGGPTALAPAVFNSPTQTVVGGSHLAVGELIAAAEEELYARGIVVESRIPMHTPRFEPVVEPFQDVLRDTPWTGKSRIPYRPNVTAVASDATAPAFLRACLARHVCEPVRWRASVDAIAAELPDAVFLETGPRTVLRDLMKRRWHADRDIFAIDDPEVPTRAAALQVEATLDAVRRALSAPTGSPPAGATSLAVGSAES